MTVATFYRSRRPASLVKAACTALVVLAVTAADASAQAFVTGSGNTPGFSVVGRLRILKTGEPRGNFLIIVHRDSPEFTTAAVVCSYNQFDQVLIAGNMARFHSVGSCVALTTDGRQQRFTSDNVFSIIDGGQPGPGTDAIDVNFLGLAGVAIPGSVLLHGNFIVSP